MPETSQVQATLLKVQFDELRKAMRALDAIERATPRQVKPLHIGEDFWEIEIVDNQYKVTIKPIPLGDV